MKKLILKRYGLHNPTEVEYGDKILVTNQLDIKSTCDLWKWYFGLRCYERIPLYVVSKRDYNSMGQRTLASVKSVKELFYEQGFDVVLLEHESEIVSDWKLYRKSDARGGGEVKDYKRLTHKDDIYYVDVINDKHEIVCSPKSDNNLCVVLSAQKIVKLLNQLVELENIVDN